MEKPKKNIPKPKAPWHINLETIRNQLKPKNEKKGANKVAEIEDI